MMVGDRLFREITNNSWEPKRRIEEMDRVGVSMQVLSTVPVMFSYWAKPADALDLSRRLNDHIAGVVRDHPKRFSGLGTIPMQDADLAASELQRCVRELGLCGAQIGTHVDANPHFGRVDTLNLDNAALQPVWSAVFVDCLKTTRRDTNPNEFLQLTASTRFLSGSSGFGHLVSSHRPPRIHSPFGVFFTCAAMRLANSSGFAASVR